MRILLLATALLLASPAPTTRAAEEVLYVRWAGSLRAEPSLGARRVGAVPARARAVFLGARSDLEEIEGVAGRWAKVRVGDKEGWLFDRNLSFEKPLTAEETKQALLERAVRCEGAVLKLKPGGTGSASAETRAGETAPRLLNVRWWGDGPFYVAFEAWRSRAGTLAQEGLTLCELEYVDARETFEGRLVDLRRRAPNTMVPLGLDGECRTPADADCPAVASAVAQGRVEIVRSKLAQGVPVDQTTRWGWTALHHAARSTRPELVTALLERGANVGAKGRDGCSPLHLAAGAGSTQIVTALLERKADPGDMDRSGRTPLHWAADRGQATSIQELLKRGAAADQRDFHGWPALSYAARQGHLEAMRALLVGGANPNARDGDDATPLHAAAADCRSEAVGLLLSKGADPSLRDRYGLLPLHHAYFARCSPVPASLQSKLKTRTRDP